MSTRPVLPGALVVLALHGAAATAQSLTIDNAGFEAPTIPAGSFLTDADPPGWGSFGPIDHQLRTVGVLHPAGTQLYPAGAPEGDNVGVVFLLDDLGDQTAFAGLEAGLQQELDDVLQASTVYTLSVEVGNIGDDPSPPHDAFAFAGFPGYRIELVAGGTVLTVDDDSLSPVDGAFATSVRTAVTGIHPPDEGAPLVIRLVNLNAAPGLEVNFDDVRLTAEPIWVGLGGGKPGVAGVPQLSGAGSLLAGSSNQVDLADAAPGAAATLVVGLAALHVPFKGGTLVPEPLLLLPAPTDGTGSASVPFVWPAGIPSGTELFLQWWVPDGAATVNLAASDGLRGTTP